MRTDVAKNSSYIAHVKGSGAFQTFSESFMEAGPQLVLQTSIAIFREYASKGGGKAENGFPFSSSTSSVQVLPK